MSEKKGGLRVGVKLESPWMREVKESLMHEPYRFLNTRVQDAAMNMAIDESVLIHHLQGEAPPTLRVFRWSQPSISLGRFQSIEREIFGEVRQQQRVALVPRPTG